MQLFNVGLQAGIVEEDVVRLFRLGKRGDRARPLLIQLASYTCKNLIMESLFKLRHAESKFKKVVVAHDMTRAERDEMKRLVEDAKALSESDDSGEYHYKVRGFPGKMRVVKLKIRN